VTGGKGIPKERGNWSWKVAEGELKKDSDRESSYKEIDEKLEK
jgi:hypothetical protein